MSAARILIVEDDTLAARDFQATLAKHGYSVPFIARTGVDAIRMVEESSPDLILLDIRLEGDLDGFQTAAKIQESRDVPILYLSGDGDDLSMNRAQVTYPYGYLVKPVSGPDLIQAVENALKRSRSQGEYSRAIKTALQTLRSISDGIITTDLMGRITFMNRAAEELTGHDTASALEAPLNDIFQIEQGPVTLLRRPDGSTVEIEENTAPIETESGELAGLITTFRDVSGRGTAGSPASDPIVQGITDPLFSFDARWRITYVNAAAAECYTLPRQEIIGRDFWADFSEDDKAHYFPEFEKARAENRPHEFEFHQKSNNVWFHIRLYPFSGGTLAIFRDITERKYSENESRRVERLESLGFLARGFAHDFNNLLTVILCRLAIAREGADKPELTQDLEQASLATQQAQSLVQQLMTFAQGGAPIKETVQPGAILDAIVAERRRATPAVHYQLINECGDASLRADRKQIGRLLENLIVNAERAMNNTGTVFLRCRRDEPNGSEQEFLVIEVIDSGHGMDRDTIDHAFDPFFTTHRSINATGLGLTVCESIARAHGGTLKLRSKPGEGTVASVYLPLAKPDSEPILLETAHETGRAPANGHDRVLVLEDEGLIRNLIQATLSKAGYEVAGTKEGLETIQAYEEALSSGKPYDLVIMDLTIEHGMGGVEALNRLKEIDPDVRAIVSSGYSDDPAMANPAAYGFSGVLPKPYEPQQLVEIVDRLCNGSRS